LRFVPASELIQNQWDIHSIVGQIPDHDIGALHLYIPTSFTEYWHYYYPELSRYELDNVYYFNVNLASLGQRIKPLIEKYVPEILALEELNNSSVPQTGDWKEDYFQLFLTGSIFLSVSGGDAIADIADNDRLNPDQRFYRLSAFYMQGTFYDNTPRIDDLFTYRQRLPGISDQNLAFQERTSLAGHPLITERTAVPIAAARVDFVDQEIYGRKIVDYLELDPDTDPPTLRVQNPPTANQLATAQYHGVDLTGHGTAYFTLYNPDGEILTISDSSGALTLTPTQIGANDWQALISVSAGGSIPDPTTINISSGSNLVKQLLVKSFDFRLMPVSFWFLDPLNPNDYDFDAIYTELNRVLGRQANIITYPAASTNQDPRQQTIQIPSLSDTNHRIEITAPFINQAPGHVMNAEITEHDINVIFTWKLGQGKNGPIEEKKLNGVTTRTSDTDPRPIIFVDVVTHNPLRIGATTAHEIGHFFGQQIRREAILSTTDLSAELEEFHHGKRDDLLDLGSSAFIYNLMYRGRPAINKLLTTSQADLINQLAANIV
jgi:hypothetical protein